MVCRSSVVSVSNLGPRYTPVGQELFHVLDVRKRREKTSETSRDIEENLPILNVSSPLLSSHRPINEKSRGDPYPYILHRGNQIETYLFRGPSSTTGSRNFLRKPLRKSIRPQSVLNEPRTDRTGRAQKDMLK